MSVCFASVVLAVCMETDHPTEINVFSPGIELISSQTPSSDRLTAAVSTFCLVLDFLRAQISLEPLL